MDPAARPAVARMILVVAALAAIAAPAPGCNTVACTRRVQHKQLVAHKRRVVAPHRAWLIRVARCESGGDWSTNTGNGHYGGVQFTLQSWRAVGGRGYPHQHGRLEQMYRAVRLLRIQGPGAWPVCQRH